jgi:orotate phosphoribosyltransferase
MPAMTMPAVNRSRLIEIIKARSVETGRVFKLASGRESDFYCNLKPTMMDPEGAYLIGSLINDAIGGTRRLIEGLDRGATLAGKRVVIVEDVTTTGGSSVKAIEAVRADGGNVVRVITVVDRQEGAAETFSGIGVPFSSLVVASELR